jgi:hypothetical protein
MAHLRSLFVALLATLLSVSTASAQARVDPGARELLAYRLSVDTLVKLRQVMLVMDGFRPTSPEMPRSDVAMIGVLAMTAPFGEAFTDEKISQTVAVLERGHPELVRAISYAHLSTREYVLAWTTLLLTHPAVSARRNTGRFVDPGVALDNIAFVEQHWNQIDGFMNDMNARIPRASYR